MIEHIQMVLLTPSYRCTLKLSPGQKIKSSLEIKKNVVVKGTQSDGKY